MNCDLSLLQQGLSKWNIDIDENALSKFDNYISFILEWNKKMNLTKIVEPSEMIVEHFLDSLSVLPLEILDQESRIIDVGSGAGFPGIPIKIMLPKCNMTLIDSLNKRIEFLKYTASELDLSNINIIHTRAEDIAHNISHRECYDLAVSRAVAPLRVLLEYCLPFVRVGGFFIAYKGPAATEEADEAKNALKMLGGELADIKQVDLPYSDKNHRLILIHKFTKTNKKFPREPGKPKKSPL